MIVSPQRAPIDEPVLIRLENLAPGERITLRARMQGHLGASWMAEACFVADSDGVIDVSRDAPIAGSYEGIDLMGLFWSMREVPADGAPPPSPLTVVVTAERSGEAIASAAAERVMVPDGVAMSEIRDRGLVGVFFRPPGEGPYRAVLVVSGSNGALNGSRQMAAQLARHGFATLALAYFGMESLPPLPVSMPLEYFETALEWLVEQPETYGEGIGAIGPSLGGELVLLLGATYPRVRAVVAYVPSHVVWRGRGPGVPPRSPSWTLRGEPLPIMRRSSPPPPPPPTPQDVPLATTPSFLDTLSDRVAEQRAAIPVERINGPVLLISGREDAMWPSTLMAERAVERLTAHGHPHRVEHLAYDGAGHDVFLPHLPTTRRSQSSAIAGRLVALGGNARDTAGACADSWPRVINFLHDSLRPVSR